LKKAKISINTIINRKANARTKENKYLMGTILNSIKPKNIPDNYIKGLTFSLANTIAPANRG